MNIDIQTEHVAMRPEWHVMIDTWLERCRKRHPDVVNIDLSLRHGDARLSGDEVKAIATARGRNLRAGTRADEMTLALYDALETLERELVLNEAIRPDPKRSLGSGIQ